MQFIDLKAQAAALNGAIEANIARVMDHGQFIMGPEVTELEARLAARTGVAHAIGVSNGTDAIQIALMALGIGPGDEVITSPFSFFAAVEVILLLGATPVFVDIDPVTYNLDPALLTAAITARTKAIIPVDLFGQCADYDAINAIATEHGLPVIEDAAQSLGARQREREAGALATIATTSFFPSKPLGGYGDGGAIFTNDAALAEKMAQIRTHGQERRYHHVAVGINGRLDTLQAAILLAKLDVFDREVIERARIGARYSERIGALTNRAVTPALMPGNTSVYAQYTIRVADRDQVVARLNQAGIPTAVHYPAALSRQPALGAAMLSEGTMPASEQAAREVLSLPMHPYLTEADQDRVVDALTRALA